MTIRKAEEKDLTAVAELLGQILKLHHRGRPDLFCDGGRKYTDEELLEIFFDPKRPVLVAEEEKKVVGYAFCILQEVSQSHVLAPVKTLYLDDLCVDESCRGKGVGKKLYEAVVLLAREMGCYNLTLNVWAFNEGAKGFYESLGMNPQRIYMETIL